VGNCAPPDATNPRSVDVSVGAVVTVAFSVTCSAAHGVVEITTATSGFDLDPDGYTVQVDNGTPQRLPVNGMVRFNVEGGEHTVTLAGMTANCPVSGNNPRTVSVTTGGPTRDTVRTTFQVTCRWTTGLAVLIATSGSDLDDSYFVGVDQVCDEYWGCYYPWSEWASANDTVRFAPVPVGEHAVYLDDIAPNCRLAGDNPITATVPTGGPATVTFAVACEQTGRVRASVTTIGADLDPDGYFVLAQGAGWSAGQYVGTNASATISRLPAGEYSVTLSSLAANCAVNGQNPVTATVVAGATVDVAFAVTCAALGSIQVTAATTGADLDPDGYSVRVQRAGDSRTYTVGPNGTVTISGLAAGDYLVALDGVAPNCQVGGANPRTVAVSSGGTALVQFDFTCVALGRIQVTAVTTGVDLDPDGYSVNVYGAGFGQSYNVGPNGTVTIPGLVAGDYVVDLYAVAANCEVTNPATQTVAVPSGGGAVVQFDVVCGALGQLAVVMSDGDEEIYLIKSNGTGLTRLTTNSAADVQPAWSPDGGKVAFATNQDGNFEIYVMNADGQIRTRRTVAPGVDQAPAWSPDGSRIAFTSDRDGNTEIYVMNADGSNPMRLTNHPESDTDPAWSPDGSRIAFSSTRDGNAEIYVMDPTGSALTRLTSNYVDDVQPAWSPDGTKLVFSRFAWCDSYSGFCDYDLFLMSADGSGAAQLTAASSDADPAWSPDGRLIAYGASFCSYDWYYGCYYDYSAVQVLRADGTGVGELVRGAFQPAWRP
jgi:TolB protein